MWLKIKGITVYSAKEEVKYKKQFTAFIFHLSGGRALCLTPNQPSGFYLTFNQERILELTKDLNEVYCFK